MIRKILAVVVSVMGLMSLKAEDLSSRVYLGSIPSVSADGSFFVFEWCDRIWRASSSGGEAVALTDGMTRDIRPILSPDSKRMAFLSNRNGGWKLFEMGLADTPGLRQGDVRQISFHSEDVILRGYTSDSTKMLANVNYDYSLDDKSPFHGFNRAVLLPLDRRGREELLFDAPARDPALSPDGGKLLFVDRGDGSEPSYKKRIPSHKKSSFARIWLYDIKTKTFSKLVDRSSDSRCPIWIPDGDGFYYMNDEDGVRNVYYRSLESGKDRKITNFRDDHVFAPTLSRDGRTMIIRKGFDFWRLDPTQKEPIPERIQLIPAGNMPASSKIRKRWYTTAWNNNAAGCIDFTNEGKEIAFTVGGDLWVMDTTLRQPVRIHASSLTHERDCRFSKDGSTLYYLSDRGEGVDIWRAVRADPKRAWWENTDFVCTRLTRDDVYREKLSIAPDDKHLAWVNRTGKIFFADTNAVVLSVSQVKTTSCAVYSWSPDSRWVAGSFKDAYGNFDVWIVPAFVKNDDGTPPPAPYNISRHQKYDGFPAWSSDGKIIAFSGVRAKNNDASTIFYAYLNPKDEELENPCEKTIRDAIEKTTPNKKDKESDKKAGGDKTENVKTEIVFDDLFERVRETDIRGEKPCFGYDTRKLAFHANGNVHVITIPNNLKPSKVLSKAGDIIKWIKVGKDDKFLRSIGSQPAHGDQIFGFKVYQETNVEDYQELAFLSGWALLRDMFCDPNMHGANWPAVKEKYRLAARHAPAWSVFNRVMQMMIGELDASHQGFWISDAAKKEWDIAPSRQSWEEVTAHIGARYDSSHTNDGWKVSDVVPRSPADRGEEGLLQGDIVMSIDGIKLKPSMDVSEVMNTPMPHKFRVEYIRNGTNKILFAEAVTYSKIRELLRAESIRSMRKLVRKSGDFGYINISAMDNRSLNDFMDSIFAEGFGKEGLIIDVRYNGGGYIADRVLDVLCGPSHSRALIRGDAGEGYLLSYWGRPLLPSLPIVVLCNWRSASNAEIFTHAIKTLKRGKIVGIQTAGSVIATQNIPLLDMGTIRKSYIGWFTADGTDMEFNGAKPDIEVDITPEDIVKGRDTQLDAAIRVLKKESANASKLPPLKFAK
jgi:tricorn protease